MLADMEQEIRPHFPHGILGGQGIINEKMAATGRGRYRPAQDGLLLFSARCLGVEKGLYLGHAAARPDEIHGKLVSKDEADRLQDETFASSRLSREDIHAPAELEFHIINEGEPFDAQVFQHA